MFRFHYLPETSENLWFSVFKGYKKCTMVWNALILKAPSDADVGLVPFSHVWSLILILITVNHSISMIHSYWNQWIDLDCKPIDWVLHDAFIGR